MSYHAYRVYYRLAEQLDTMCHNLVPSIAELSAALPFMHQ